MIEEWFMVSGKVVKKGSNVLNSNVGRIKRVVGRWCEFRNPDPGTLAMEYGTRSN